MLENVYEVINASQKCACMKALILKNVYEGYKCSFQSEFLLSFASLFQSYWLHLFDFSLFSARDTGSWTMLIKFTCIVSFICDTKNIGNYSMHWASYNFKEQTISCLGLKLRCQWWPVDCAWRGQNSRSGDQRQVLCNSFFSAFCTRTLCMSGTNKFGGLRT